MYRGQPQSHHHHHQWSNSFQSNSYAAPGRKGSMAVSDFPNPFDSPRTHDRPDSYAAQQDFQPHFQAPTAGASTRARHASINRFAADFGFGDAMHLFQTSDPYSHEDSAALDSWGPGLDALDSLDLADVSDRQSVAGYRCSYADWKEFFPQPSQSHNSMAGDVAGSAYETVGQRRFSRHRVSILSQNLHHARRRSSLMFGGPPVSSSARMSNRPSILFNRRPSHLQSEPLSAGPPYSQQHRPSFNARKSIVHRSSIDSYIESLERRSSMYKEPPNQPPSSMHMNYRQSIAGSIRSVGSLDVDAMLDIWQHQDPGPREPTPLFAASDVKVRPEPVSNVSRMGPPTASAVASRALKRTSQLSNKWITNSGTSSPGTENPPSYHSSPRTTDRSNAGEVREKQLLSPRFQSITSAFIDSEPAAGSSTSAQSAPDPSTKIVAYDDMEARLLSPQMSHEIQRTPSVQRRSMATIETVESEHENDGGLPSATAAIMGLMSGTTSVAASPTGSPMFSPRFQQPQTFQSMHALAVSPKGGDGRPDFDAQVKGSNGPPTLKLEMPPAEDCPGPASLRTAASDRSLSSTESSSSESSASTDKSHGSSTEGAIRIVHRPTDADAVTEADLTCWRSAKSSPCASVRQPTDTAKDVIVPSTGRGRSKTISSGNGSGNGKSKGPGRLSRLLGALKRASSSSLRMSSSSTKA